MNDLLSHVRKTAAYGALQRGRGRFVVDETIGVSLLFAALFQEKPAVYTLIAANLYNAQKIADMLSDLLGEEHVLLFPSDDVLRSELQASSRELLAQRLYVMGEALKKKPRILIVHAASLLMPLPPLKDFKDAIIFLRKGSKVDLEDLRTRLVEAGYYRVPRIDQSLQFASRGDILDVYGVNHARPVRIELFDDVIESIAAFDITTQTSGERLDEVVIYPANQLLLSREEIEAFSKRFKGLVADQEAKLSPAAADILKEESEHDLELLQSRLYQPRLNKYYRLIKKDAVSILAYFPSDLTFVANEEQFTVTVNYNLDEAERYLVELSSAGRLLPGLQPYLDLKAVLAGAGVVLFGHTEHRSDDDAVFRTAPVILARSDIEELKEIIASYLRLNDHLVLALSSKRQFEIIKDLLATLGEPYEILHGLALPEKTKLGLTLAALDRGFELPDFHLTFLSAYELFGHQDRPSRHFRRFKEGTILRSFDDLVPGDYVVHEHYGIGRFLKIETIEIEGVHRDFLHLAYRGGAVLDVPLSQFRLVRKYAGREGVSPTLSFLGGTEWEKTKKKIKERINELADRLYRLYEARAALAGVAAAKDDEIQRAFESGFPYELTADQERSLQEIKNDMEAPRVMDRLLCGDVGFGKTELAFRAAFKAILSGHQAAILCPTTLLARQHYELALQRFAGYGVRIAVLSRLVDPARQKKAIQAIEDGEIHLIIGTHRLLAKEVVFHDLGLLIIDEEQRFGVEQKERIKEIKTDVDVLSLSATPIPRTLQLSLIGLREVSEITTPPEDRSPIQTYVMPYRQAIVKELIERELQRRGQVFYVHNSIAGIKHVAEVLARLIPGVTIGVVHGKMHKDDIEDVMLRFYQGRIAVLVATSIIENGIDVPNANLIIVEDADRFGLAQLYQIKGRVGRSDRLAYAYLFYRPEKTIREDARKRLKAIQDFVELGSGYKIAQRDLMIRGAGDILGPEQAGFIDSVGLDLYLKMLREVMEEKKTGRKKLAPQPVRLLRLDAYLPKEYVSEEDKVEWYQEIENAPTRKELALIRSKMRDVYGRLPPEVDLLFRKRALDIALNGPAFVEIGESDEEYIVTTSSAFSSLNGIGIRLFACLEPLVDKIRVTYLRKVLQIRISKAENWLPVLEAVIEAIETLFEKHGKKDG